MKLLLYHKNNYIFDKTDDDLITVSIHFKHNKRHDLKNNYALYNFFQYYIRKKINDMYDLFPTMDFKFFESHIIIIFSKENEEGFEKAIKHLFIIEKNYTSIISKYLQNIEKYQYNDSYMFIDKILYENTTIHYDPRLLYTNSKKLKNNDVIEYMKIAFNNLFIVISGHSENPYKKIIYDNILNNNKLLENTYFEKDKKIVENKINNQHYFLVPSTKHTVSLIELYFITFNESIDVSLLYYLINLTDIVNKYYGEWHINYGNDYPYNMIKIIINIEPKFIKDILIDIFKYLKEIKNNVKDIEDAKKRKLLYLDYNLSNTETRHMFIIRESNKYKPNYDFRGLREYYKNITLKEVKEQLTELITTENMKIFLIGITQNDYDDIIKKNIMVI